MAPYWILLLFSFGLGFEICERKKSRNRDRIFLIIITILMLLMEGLRAPTVGSDTARYLDYFSNVCNNSNQYRFEPGYDLLNVLISKITHNPNIFMGLVSGIIIILRSIFIYLYSSSTWISVFVFISFGFFGYSMCTLRQELGISILLFAIPLLQKKKIIPYMLLVIVAGIFHMSLWFMIAIYFIANLPLNKFTIALYSTATLVILCFSENILKFITQYIYKQYEAGGYYTMPRDYSTAFIPVLVCVIALIFSKQLLARNPQNIVLINFSFYSALLFILTVRHFIFQRLALIFLPVVLLLIPEIFCCIEPKSNNKIELRREIGLYYASMCLILGGCSIYYLFLLSTNRLMLVPYIMMI